jgi:Flp pilus assembly protein TadG
MNAPKIITPFQQRGVAAVEFALIASIFFTLLFGVMEMGRILFYMNSAAEVTRLGARVAVVCDVNAAVIKNKMINMLDILTAADITINYTPATCNTSTCESVTVSVSKRDIQTFIPFAPLKFSLPAFSTSLPRESLTSANNPVCS